MFEQIVGSGANAFVIIIAVAVGFIGALTAIDSRKTFKDNEDNQPFKD